MDNDKNISEEVKEEENVKRKKENKPKPIKVKNKKLNKPYFGYMLRVVSFAIAFMALIGTSILLVYKSFVVDNGKIINYQESGNMDYKVYLKPNQFYETPYLSNDMTYIARLINNIDVDINYKFAIDEKVDLDFTYNVIAKLTISNAERQRLFEKEYTLISEKNQKIENDNSINITEKLSINYDQYNDLANDFKSEFGVDTNSDLSIYVRVNKNVNNKDNSINLANGSEMTLSIPLTQKTINIAINNTNINNSNSIIEEKKVTVGNIAFIGIAFILFVASVAALLRTLELLFVISPKPSKYDKYIKKILNEYDRLVVETTTEPNLTGDNNIIKINKFQELLDVRDNVKRPIMYYIVNKHEKCYFYVQNDNNCYLLTVKAVDLEKEDIKVKRK